MRTVNNNGFSTIVSNEEYALIRKIKAKGKVLEDYFNEYYQELCYKLISRGLLDIIESDGKNYFVVKGKNNEGSRSDQSDV